MLKQLQTSPIGQAIQVFVFMLLIAAVFAWVFQPLLVPLIISAAMYSLLESYTAGLVRKGYSHALSVSVTLIGVICLLVLTILLFIPVILDQVSQLQSHLPVVIDKISSLGDSLTQWISGNMGIAVQSNQLAEQWIASIQSMGTTAVMSSAGFLIQLSMALILVPLITFFLLKDYRKARNYVLAWLPNTKFELGWLIYHRVTKQLQRYVRGVVAQSGIMAIVASFGYSIIGLDMALLFGGLAGLLNVIPYVGPVVAALLPIAVVVTSGAVDVWLIVGIVSVVFIAQAIDNIVVIPSIIASSVGLHPMVVLFGVIIIGSSFGIMGMLLAVPLMATVKIIWHGLVYGLQGHNEVEVGANLNHSPASV